MYNIMLFGSGSIPELTQEALDMIVKYNTQQSRFMLADGSGIDNAFNKWLSALGIRENSVVYGLGYIRKNQYALNSEVISMLYSEKDKTVRYINNDGTVMHEVEDVEDLDKFMVSSRSYTALDRIMAKQCNAAICVWDGKTKAEGEIISYLNILGKPCHVFIVDI